MVFNTSSTPLSYPFSIREVFLFFPNYLLPIFAPNNLVMVIPPPCFFPETAGHYTSLPPPHWPRIGTLLPRPLQYYIRRRCITNTAANLLLNSGQMLPHWVQPLPLPAPAPSNFTPVPSNFTLALFHLAPFRYPPTAALSTGLTGGHTFRCMTYSPI